GADLVFGEGVRVAPVGDDRDADLGGSVLVDRYSEVEFGDADAVGSGRVEQRGAVDGVEGDGAVGAGGLDADDQFRGGGLLGGGVEGHGGEFRDGVHTDDQAG